MWSIVQLLSSGSLTAKPLLRMQNRKSTSAQTDRTVYHLAFASKRSKVPFGSQASITPSAAIIAMIMVKAMVSIESLLSIS